MDLSDEVMLIISAIKVSQNFWIFDTDMETKSTLSVVVKLCRNRISIFNLHKLRKVVIDKSQVVTSVLSSVHVVSHDVLRDASDTISEFEIFATVADAKIDIDDVATFVVLVFPLKIKQQFL